MDIAIIGCGYVADYYFTTLENYPQLNVLGVYDKNLERAQRISKVYGVNVFKSFKEMLDSSAQIIVNLTNPRNHYEISSAALEANKHVYTEKVLATTFEDAKNLVTLAKSKGKIISSAPSSLLSETAQTMWKTLRDNLIGNVKLVYGELDDGPIYLMNPGEWRSVSGCSWPAKDEYEVGCTLEHAGYHLSWLCAFFGPALSVTAFSRCILKDKKWPEILDPPDAPDFSVACIQFSSGVVARLTFSIVAPHNQELRIIGDKGSIYTKECWNYGAPVYHQTFSSRNLSAIRYPVIRENPLFSRVLKLHGKKIPLLKAPVKRRFPHIFKDISMDFSRGICELANAIQEKRDCRLSSNFSLHVTELILAIHNALDNSGTYNTTTSFTPLAPMPWAL